MPHLFSDPELAMSVSALTSGDSRVDAAIARFEKLCHEKEVPIDASLTSIVVRKSERRLYLFSGGVLLAEFPIRIGRVPHGHKQAEGDRRTPEGDYYICYLNPESSFHLFMGLSYPNAEDARAAYEEARISKGKCEEIEQAISGKDCPDWYTPLGGEVGIHGGGVKMYGTLGCIGLSNEDVESIWGSAQIGTPVKIEK